MQKIKQKIPSNFPNVVKAIIELGQSHARIGKASYIVMGGGGGVCEKLLGHVLVIFVVICGYCPCFNLILDFFFV